MTPTFPDEPTDGFPTPPREFTDRDDRVLQVDVVDSDDVEDLLDMYQEFEPEDRAQGIPPAREEAIRDWLETVVSEDSLGVIARLDDTVTGHAMLVPDASGGYELAIFVSHEYQGKGIGTELVRTMLGRAQEKGIERVWLTVERWNDSAIRIYETVGFETTDRQSFELEMGLLLASD